MTFLPKKSAKSVAIVPVTPAELKKLDPKTRAWTQSAGFSGASGSLILLPDGKGGLSRVLFGVDEAEGLYAYASLPAKLPENGGGYYIDKKMDKAAASRTALGWALGCYQFARYKSGKKKEFAALAWPDNADRKGVAAAADAVFRARDIINTPPNDFGPAELEAEVKKLAREIGGKVSVVSGRALEQGWGCVYAVGRGSPRAPRVIDLRWGNPKNPKVTLVGKGVCFDTGGVSVKPLSNMLLMKKDMGGAAVALGIARMIAAAKLPVRLRVLIPAVENAVDGDSFRPGDIVKSRKGLTVEIGNPDAEGRLILCDALAEACREKPDLLMDFGTLTGPSTLGGDLPSMFSNDDKTAAALLAAADRADDPLWRLPLWKPYRGALDSKVADVNNAGGQAGAITCALFLEKFVDKGVRWTHMDFTGWNYFSRPGRPEGAEVQGMRAAFEMIRGRFG